MADPNTPAEWLARAAEATGIAERMHDALPRKTMLEIAAGYERLARYAGSAPVRVAAERKQEVPVAQVTFTDIYRSSNGDCWRLISDPSGRRVRHEPNPASGGQAMETPVEDFLAVNGPGPEYRGFAANARQQRGANRNCGLLISPFIRQNGLDIEQRQPMRLTERVATGDVG